MKLNSLNTFYYLSLLGGVIVWFIIFILTPAEVINPLSNETISFVLISYFFLILGFTLKKFKFQIKKNNINQKNLFWISMFIIVCFILRYFDLFVLRNLSFSNNIHENRILSEKSSGNVFLIGASIIKSLYFVPLLISCIQKKYSSCFFWFGLLFFLFPVPEAILKGSRSIILTSFLYLILILFFTRKIVLNKKTLTLIALTFIGLFVIGTNILMKRESPKNKNAYNHLIEKAIYNDFFKPKQKIIDYVNNEQVSNTKKAMTISAMQVGQYYCHGVFEFDHIVKYYKKNDYQRQWGKYTFFVFPKFTNQMGLTNYDLSKINHASPRGYTFITFFGGMYLDFGWFALLFMFLLGVVQKMVVELVKKQHFIFAPLYLFFLFTNFFLPTFNFYRGTGSYLFVSCICFATLFYFVLKKPTMSN